MWSRTFITAVGERALKTFAQALAAALTAGGVGLFHVGWQAALATSAIAAALSVLTSIASGTVTPEGSPSLVEDPATAAAVAAAVKHPANRGRS
jgi:hypothetical protein